MLTNHGENHMAKTTFLAIDPTGNVHTRKSEHGYTHAVLVRNSKAAALHHANVVSYKWSLEAAREQFLYATWTIERFNTMLRAKRCEILARDNRYAEESIAKAKAFVAQHGTIEAYAESERAKNVATIEAKDYSLWKVASFNSRRDLAEKEASKQRSREWTGDVVIVNAMAR